MRIRVRIEVRVWASSFLFLSDANPKLNPTLEVLPDLKIELWGDDDFYGTCVGEDKATPIPKTGLGSRSTRIVLFANPNPNPNPNPNSNPNSTPNRR